MVKTLKEKILSGIRIGYDDAILLEKVELEELCCAADEIRAYFYGNGFDTCTITNGKNGRCSEDCKYCAQSIHYPVVIEDYPLRNDKRFLEEAQYNLQRGILRFSVVTSGRKLNTQEVDQMCEIYCTIKKQCGIALCASHGLLDYPHFVKLKEAGVERYHNNLETSRRYFTNICTTHTYDDKITAIKNAQKAGLTVCSGGIMGLGESMKDRIEMAIELRELGIWSVPINILNPIKNTPFENFPTLTSSEIRRIVAIYRFLLPDAVLRLAGGRGLMLDKGKSVFGSGANAAISGDILNTAGISIEQDMKMIKELNYEVKMI